MQYILPFVVVVLAFLWVRYFPIKKQENLQLLLTFSGTFLLAVTVLHLLPQVYNRDSVMPVGYFIMGGLLLQIALAYFSKGAEHGHVHLPKNKVFPWLVFSSLCLHAFIEGLPLEQNHNFLIGVVVHKIPVVLILSSVLLASGISNKKLGFFLIVFALMTPLGTAFTQFVPVLKNYLHLLTAFVIGIFLHVATVIIFESSENHHLTLKRILVIIVGVAAAVII